MRALLLLPMLFALAACEQQMQDMYVQPRAQQLRGSPIFDDGGSARPPVPGTFAYSSGVLAGTSSGRQRGTEQMLAAVSKAQTNPYPITAALLQRGRERFDVDCVPCHSPIGDGDGLVTRRGFPHPPSYHIDRLRQAPDRYFYDVISNGHGIMLPYANRVSPPDRWAIVAYIRALQRSQNVAAAIPPAETGRSQPERKP